MTIISKKTHIVLFYLILFVSTLYSQICHAKVNQSTINGIQKIIDQDRIRYDIPGIQVSIIFPGETEPYDFVSGTTTIDCQNMITPKHLFQISSETKSFTAILLLQLEAAGKLSLDDPIGKWVRNVPVNWKNITIRQLLNHTSGIYEYLDTMWFSHIATDSDYKHQWTPNALIHMSFDQEPYFAPGAGWHYSNTNYILAGMVIAEASGKSLEENMQKLFNQAHLSNTYYIPSAYNEQMMQQMAHGYSESGMFPNEPRDVTYINMSMAGAAGAIVSTTHDTAIWMKKLMTGYILPAKQLKVFMSTVSTDNGQQQPTTTQDIGYGLGIVHNTLIDDFDFFKEDRWSHEGGGIGYRSLMVYLKSSDIVITTAINHVRQPDEKEVTDNDHLVMDVLAFIMKADASKKAGA